MPESRLDMNPNVVDFIDRLGLPAWAAALLALSVAGLLAILVRKGLEAIAMRFTRRRAPAVHALIRALRTPVTLLLFLLGVQISIDLAALPPRFREAPEKAVAVLSILVAAYGFGKGLLALINAESPLSQRLQPVSGFLKGFVRVVVAAVAILLALQSLGIAVTPLLASIGLGSAAIAFALRETFEGLFAGIAILADHPIRVGERIRVEPDLEGRVVTIGLRTTSLLDQNDNLLILPNTLLVRNAIRNFDRPTAGELTPLKILLEHGTPVPAALGAARKAAAPLGGTANLSDVTPAGIELTVSLPVRQRDERLSVRAEGFQALARELEQAGIAFARQPTGAGPASPQAKS